MRLGIKERKEKNHNYKKPFPEGIQRWNRLNPVTHALVCIMFLILNILTVLPLIFVTIVSFSSEQSISEKGYSFFPSSLSLDAYRYVIKRIDFIGHSFMLSCFISIVGTLLALYLISTMAYALSKPEFPYRKLCTIFIMIPMFFSGGLAASYAINTQLFMLKDTLWALILPGACSSWYILVMKTYFQDNTPRELVDAARMDGASDFEIFTRIVLPLGRPIVITVGVFTALGYWNSWYYAMLYISQNRRDLFPLQYVLYNLQRSVDFMNANEGMAGVVMNLPTESFRMAMVVIILLPLIISYPFFRKAFIRGLTFGALKE